ncbi:TPA: hypothetical protein DIC38_00710 [Candidatus Nomurabacteria bacterium]|nr:MAG: OmpA/MotB protein [Parcubacteria bacterium RAAC4_OD1_1]HCY26192.1 hypothetical protein [Candidatus Nomurabacteria bacterium]
MKNYMKKIIVGMFAFVVLFAGQSLFASGPFNGQSGDCNPAIAIGVYPNNIPKDSYGCWTATSINANPGDIVNIAMYYHNNTNQPLTNVYGSIIKSSSGPSNTFTFTGKMYSDQGSQTIGTVTLKLSSSQTISYSSTHWMKDANAVKSDTDTDVFYNDGGKIYLGTVQPGWNYFGELLAVYKVSQNTTPEPDICTDPDATNYGEIGDCIIPTPKYCKISYFTIDGKSSSSINKGDYSKLEWGTENCTSVSLSGTGSVSSSSSINVRPNYSTSYTLTAYSPTTGNITKTVYVNVASQPDNICTNPSATNYGQIGDCVFSNPKYCQINNFSASDTSIEKGDTSTLTWTTSNCNYVVLSSYGQLSANSSKSVKPSYDTVYTLTAYGNNGNDEDTVKIYVDEGSNDDNECRITDFSSDDTTVDDGDYVELEWETENCDYVNIAGVGSYMNENDSERVKMTSTKTFTLKAYGKNGSDSDTLKIYVDEDNDNDNDNDNECRVVDFSASNTSVKKGDPVVIDWDTEDCDYVNISGIGSYLNPTDDYRFYPPYTGTYTIKAYGYNGTDSDSLKVYVNETIDPNPIYEVNSSVVTTVATNITQNSALLNGLVTNSNSTTANVYFEYGTSVNLGSRTGTKTVNGNSSFSDYVYGLKANTIYYFRAVSENNNGISRGSIQVFRTIGVTSQTTNTIIRTVVEGTTVVGTASPVILEISNRYQYLGIGDLVDYTVYYKNIGNSTLRNPMLQVVLPSGITLLNSSAGTFSNETNTLSVPIMDLKKGEEGILYLQGRVDSIPDGLAQIVTTAIFVYTSSNGAQENAMAYVLNNPKVMIVGGVSNNLGAAAFLSGGFVNIGFIGWLLIVLIILLMVLVARLFFRDRTVVYTPSNHNSH